MFLAPTVLSAAINGLFWACAAAIVWLPLTASSKSHLMRRRRRLVAIGLTAAMGLIAVVVRLFWPDLGRLAVREALGIWEVCFGAGSLLLVWATDLRMRQRRRRNDWSARSKEIGWHRQRWRLAPLIVCAAAAVIAGLGYGATAVAGDVASPPAAGFSPRAA